MNFYVIINPAPVMGYGPYCLVGDEKRSMFFSLEEAEDCLEDLQEQNDGLSHLEIHEVESEPVG
jgi:hypothetical protein